MRIAFWTASALARPLHALQRWWQGPKGPPLPATVSLSASMGTMPSLTLDDTDIAASHGERAEGTVVERAPTEPISYRPSALARVHFLPSYGLVAPTAVQKIHRIDSRPTATRDHGTPKPVRMLHCSASPQEAGHFFIAGCIADVCAELERLAAHEAAH